MTIYVGVVSQKGGCGKSTLCRILAREYAVAGWFVKIADLDTGQGTCVDWKRRRDSAGLTPSIDVEPFPTVDRAIRASAPYDLVLLDGPPHSQSGTLAIARKSNALLLPTGLSLDDLRPAVLLAHELVKQGIRAKRLMFALCRVGDRDNEIEEAREYIREAGYTVLNGSIPERTGYRRASDEGLSLTEARYPSLRTKAEKLAQSAINFIERHSKR